MAKKTTRKPDKRPLCYRCEHRAVYNETGHAARYECSQTGSAVHSCYMYAPVFPCVLRANKDDKREVGGPWAVSARCHSIGIADDMALRMRSYKDGSLIYLVPK